MILNLITFYLKTNNQFNYSKSEIKCFAQNEP